MKTSIGSNCDLAEVKVEMCVESQIRRVREVELMKMKDIYTQVTL